MNKSRIAIIGLGAVTPYGEGVNTLWQGLLEATSAFSPCDRFDLGGIACTTAGLLRTPPVIPELPHASRSLAFAAAACREALTEAGLLNHPESCQTITLITASNFGDMESVEKTLTSPSKSHEPYQRAACAQASLADILADAFHLGGPRLAVSLSCASGASAISTAAQLLANGRATRVLVVGYDVISPFSWSGLCSLRTMTKEHVRPFDLHRSGTIFSEGAAALLLERLEEGEQPCSKPLAFLTGWATGNNGFHLTAPAQRGAGSAFVMREALKRSGLAASQIDHINAHGTGTQPNDETETQAIQDLFGSSAPNIPVTSIKGTVGHLLGAAGALEAVVAILSLQHNLIPPTANYETPDPACDLDIVTSPRTAILHHVLSNSAGFGGCNAAVVLSKADSHTSLPGTLHVDNFTPGTADTPVRQPTLSAHTLSNHRPFNNLNSRYGSAGLTTCLGGQECPRSQANRPIYITGMGALCSLGSDREEIAMALREGEPALTPLSRFTYPSPPLVGQAEMPDLTLLGLSKKSYLDPASALFLAVTAQALQQAGITREVAGKESIGILSGTMYGCLETVEAFYADYLAKGPRLVKPLLFPHSYTNTPVSLAAMEWELTGEHDNHLTDAIASGTALLQAFDRLATGEVKTLVVGGVDVLSSLRLRATAETAPQGEAAATVVLSTESNAALGRLLACSLATSLAQAVEDVLQQADVSRDAIHALVVNQRASGPARKLFPNANILLPETLCGDVAGASSALHLCLGLLADLQGPFLVLTQSHSATLALLVERR
jgi:3-oxoacyl-[acyl-carrier-protein] synthase II